MVSVNMSGEGSGNEPGEDTGRGHQEFTFSER